MKKEVDYSIVISEKNALLLYPAPGRRYMSVEKANQRIDQSIEQHKIGKSPRKYSILALCFIGFLALGLVFYLTVGEELFSSRGQVVTPENRDSILAEGTEKNPEEANYEVIMSSHWTFADSKSISKDAYVENSKNNTNTVYFTVTRKDTEEVIYMSPRFAPGSYVADIKLGVPLAAGDYDTILTYYLLDEKDSVISAIPMKLSISVEK